MDPKLQQALAESLTSALSAVKEGAATAKDQIPLVVQEKLTFDMAWAIVWVTMALILVGLAFRYWKRAWQLTKEEGGDAPVILGPIVLLVTGVPMLFNNLYTVFQIYFAPRLYVIEWISGLVTKK